MMLQEIKEEFIKNWNIYIWVTMIFFYMYFISKVHEEKAKRGNIIRDSVIETPITRWIEWKGAKSIELKQYKNYTLVMRPIPALPEVPDFKTVIEVGDSLVKMPKADTFYFYKPDGRVYKYFDEYSVHKYGIKRNGRYIYEVESQ